MKYANSLKYIESFEPCAGQSGISQRSISNLCTELGRITKDIRFIHVPTGAAGHGCAVLFEGILKSAGYSVGRILSPLRYESRSCVYINGEAAQIEDYNKCVAEIKSHVSLYPDVSYCREEIVFVLSLLLCKLCGCEFVVLEGTEGLDMPCAPYELAVIPTVYGSEGAMSRIVPLCDPIRYGTREVISGNQKSEVYNYISNVCAPSGQRLFIPVKSQFEVIERGLRSLTFNYDGREGFCLRSPSLVLRDCAMTVIEAVKAMRREGVRIPISALIEGMGNAGSADMFDMLSYMPTVITDIAYSREEVELMYRTFCEIFDSERCFSVCVYAESADELERLLDGLDREKIKNVIVCTSEGNHLERDGFAVCHTCKEAAKIIASDTDIESIWMCYGGDFSVRMREEISKAARH